MPRQPTPTAEEAYVAAHLQARELTRRIADLLMDLPAPGDDDHPIRWDHVGTVQEVNRRLAGLAAFLEGNDRSTAAAPAALTPSAPAAAVQGIEYPTARDALEYKRRNAPVVIRLNGKYLVVAWEETGVLERRGDAFEIIGERDGRIMAVPVND